VSEPGGAPERRRDSSSLVIAAGLAGLAALIAWDASQISTTQAYAYVGPKAVPFAIAAGLFLLSIATAIEAIRGDTPERMPEETVPVFWILGGLAGQIALIGFAGFSIATGVLFAATARGFGRGRLYLTFPIGVAISLALWLLFAKGLDLSLPAGPLERLF
jgi:putative tricarboxylic transport membrane protein